MRQLIGGVEFAGLPCQPLPASATGVLCGIGIGIGCVLQPLARARARPLAPGYQTPAKMFLRRLMDHLLNQVLVDTLAHR